MEGGWEHSLNWVGFLVFWFIGVASSLASQGFDGPRAIINQKTKKPTLSGVLGLGPGEGCFLGLLVYDGLKVAKASGAHPEPDAPL